VDEGDDVLDLQRVLADDDSLDEQVQQHLFFLERSLRQARSDALAKSGHAGQYFLSSDPFAA
jgi:hypothetical protein